METTKRGKQKHKNACARISRAFLALLLAAAMLAGTASIQAYAAPAAAKKTTAAAKTAKAARARHPQIKDIFDAKYYADQNPDLKAVFGYDEKLLYSHFIRHGIKEGRVVSPLFDLKAYRAGNPDLNAKYGDNWSAYVQHFVRYGLQETAEGRRASTGVFFNPNAYREAYPEVAAIVGTNWLQLTQHFLKHGINEGRTEGVTTPSIVAASKEAEKKAEAAKKEEAKKTEAQAPAASESEEAPRKPKHTQKSAHTLKNFGEEEDLTDESACSQKCGLTFGQFQKGAGHRHNWSEDDGNTCSICKRTCSHEYAEDYLDGKCTNCEKSCDHKEHDEEGICETCHLAGINHNFVDTGKCEICAKPCSAHNVHTDFTGSPKKCSTCKMTLQNFQKECTNGHDDLTALPTDWKCPVCNVQGTGNDVVHTQDIQHVFNDFDRDGNCTKGCDTTLEEFQDECAHNTVIDDICRVCNHKHDWSNGNGICGLATCGKTHTHDWTKDLKNGEVNCDATGCTKKHTHSWKNAICETEDTVCTAVLTEQTCPDKLKHTNQDAGTTCPKCGYNKPHSIARAKHKGEMFDGTRCKYCSITKEQFRTAHAGSHIFIAGNTAFCLECGKLLEEYHSGHKSWTKTDTTHICGSKVSDCISLHVWNTDRSCAICKFKPTVAKHDHKFIAIDDYYSVCETGDGCQLTLMGYWNIHDHSGHWTADTNNPSQHYCDICKKTHGAQWDKAQADVKCTYEATFTVIEGDTEEQQKIVCGLICDHTSLSTEKDCPICEYNNPHTGGTKAAAEHQIGWFDKGTGECKYCTGANKVKIADFQAVHQHTFTGTEGNKICDGCELTQLKYHNGHNNWGTPNDPDKHICQVQNCGFVAAHDWNGGVCTDCNYVCEHTKYSGTEGIGTEKCEKCNMTRASYHSKHTTTPWDPPSDEGDRKTAETHTCPTCGLAHSANWGEGAAITGTCQYKVTLNGEAIACIVTCLNSKNTEEHGKDTACDICGYRKPNVPPEQPTQHPSLDAHEIGMFTNDSNSDANLKCNDSKCEYTLADFHKEKQHEFNLGGTCKVSNCISQEDYHDVHGSASYTKVVDDQKQQHSCDECGMVIDCTFNNNAWLNGKKACDDNCGNKKDCTHTWVKDATSIEKVMHKCNIGCGVEPHEASWTENSENANQHICDDASCGLTEGHTWTTDNNTDTCVCGKSGMHADGDTDGSCDTCGGSISLGSNHNSDQTSKTHNWDLSPTKNDDQNVHKCQDEGCNDTMEHKIETKCDLEGCTGKMIWDGGEENPDDVAPPPPYGGAGAGDEGSYYTNNTQPQQLESGQSDPINQQDSGNETVPVETETENPETQAEPAAEANGENATDTDAPAKEPAASVTNSRGFASLSSMMHTDGNTSAFARYANMLKAVRSKYNATLQRISDTLKRVDITIRTKAERTLFAVKHMRMAALNWTDCLK